MAEAGQKKGVWRDFGNGKLTLSAPSSSKPEKVAATIPPEKQALLIAFYQDLIRFDHGLSRPLLKMHPEAWKYFVDNPDPVKIFLQSLAEQQPSQKSKNSSMSKLLRAVFSIFTGDRSD